MADKSKHEWRAELRTIRQNESYGELQSRKLCLQLADLIHSFKNISNIFLFSALPGEPDLSYLVDYVQIAAVHYALPLIAPKSRTMAFYRWLPKQTEMRRNSFGILEPKPEPASLVNADHRTVICVPGLAFDRFGHRLGFGQGYYDRFLAACTPSHRIGVAFNQFLLPQLPHDPWDVAMDFICTDVQYKQAIRPNAQ